MNLRFDGSSRTFLAVSGTRNAAKQCVVTSRAGKRWTFLDHCLIPPADARGRALCPLDCPRAVVGEVQLLADCSPPLRREERLLPLPIAARHFAGSNDCKGSTAVRQFAVARDPIGGRLRVHCAERAFGRRR